jgi:hypothetical protein
VREREIGALLDAHDVLVRECVESLLGFEEFVAVYGDFPVALEDHTRGAGDAVSRLFGRRIAFHKLAAGVISGLRAESESSGMDGRVRRFMPMVGLMRLRELIERYPDLMVHEGPLRSTVGATR